MKCVGKGTNKKTLSFPPSPFKHPKDRANHFWMLFMGFFVVKYVTIIMGVSEIASILAIFVDNDDEGV